MSNNILVTGGAGFIGSHLIEKLIQTTHHVTVLDNLSSGSLVNIAEPMKTGKVKFVKGDIRDQKTIADIIQDVDSVIHLAAQISVTLSLQNPEFNNEVNIKGTQNLLDASTKTNIEKFVFISSCAVYGEPTYLPVDEKHPTNPISPYATSKLTAEQNTLKLNQDGLLDTTVLRFFNVYGPRQSLNDYSGVMTKFIDKIHQNQPLLIYGDGNQTRDFIYVKDIANAIVQALENKNANGEIFNIGTGKATTINQLAQTMLNLTKSNQKIEHAPQREGDIKHSYANIDKAKKTLNYQPQYSLNEGLEALLGTKQPL